jgi:uncharacterized protein (DUF1499 family)
LKKKILIITLLIIFIGVPARLYIVGKRSAAMTPTAWLVNGIFTSCPDRPNCVSSFSALTDKRHYMQPVKIDVNPIEEIISISKKFKMNILFKSDTYLRLTVKSAIFKFTDDIEFFYARPSSTLHFKSASRVGHSDLGKNRSRINEILNRLKASLK